MTELNWMQEYAAAEAVELQEEGLLSRREMLVRLVAICGTASAATAFLASCSSTPATSTAGSSTSGPATSGPATTSGSTSQAGPPGTAGGVGAGGGRSVTPPTSGGPGHILSVAPTDPDIKGENVTFPGPAATMLGYLARPAAAGSYPGVLVNHEIFGLTDHIRDVARRLAKIGYVALAVDLVSRAGGTDQAGATIAGALTQGTVEHRIADLDAGVAFLEAQPDYNGKLGVIGFCFGGGMTLSFAAANDKVLAAVPYYGPTPQPASMMSATRAAVLAQYGANDARVNAGIPDLEAALAGKTFEKKIYDGAGHAFNNDTGAAYNEAAAVQAWTATTDWLQRYLR